MLHVIEVELQTISARNSARMETAIRWSPLSTTAEQRFLLVDVTGRSSKICKVASFDGTTLQHEVLSQYSDLPPFRAFDWSPIDESLIGFGQASGDVAILRMNEEAREIFQFQKRLRRGCNAVAFSNHELLAVGAERFRSDPTLLIWDVHQCLAAGRAKSYPSIDRNSAEPLRQITLPDSVTSVKFFCDQPDTLIAGCGSEGIRLLDVRGMCD